MSILLRWLVKRKDKTPPDIGDSSDPQDSGARVKGDKSATRPPEAPTLLRGAPGNNPKDAADALRLARLMIDEGKLGEAEQTLRRAATLDSELTDACCILGNLCIAQGRPHEAREWYVKGLAAEDARVAPECKGLYARAALEMGIALIAENRFAEAVLQLRRATRLLPQWSAPYVNLAYIDLQEARPNAAIDLYRKAIDLHPAAAVPRACLLYAMNMADGDPAEIFAEHCRFGRWLEGATKRTFPAHSNPADPARALRVGYVSADFREHPVTQFLVPILEGHDRSQVVPFCYSTSRHRDEFTSELERRFAKTWRDITKLTDDEVAELIVADGIDILVDLSGHTADGRLPVFAQKPAPVQVAWLGYLNTTGVKTMDYRLVDPWTDPVGVADELHTERLVRLPDSQWAYRQTMDVPIIRANLTRDSGEIVFGSFNQYAKLSDRCLALWAQILARVPHARLRVADVPLGDHARRQLIERLERAGIAGDRVEVALRVPKMQYLKAYNEIDIALDSMPYSGATTTLDTLWMGVPIIGLAGTRAISRSTYSILKTLGRDDLTAQTPEQYVETNVRLANDAGWRNELRHTLRDELRRSPLTDIPRFVRTLEAAYRGMWRTWCAAHPRAT